MPTYSETVPVKAFLHAQSSALEWTALCWLLYRFIRNVYWAREDNISRPL